MKNYNVSEGSSVYEKLKTDPNIVVGDTITYNTNNQMGYEKYEVIVGEKGEKDLKLIDSYDHQMGYVGGKKTHKRKGRKSRKNKSRKSKSKKSRRRK